MLEKILNFSKKYEMFPDSCKVICGLSGGADSVSLLLSLLKLKQRLGISEISAIHVNHCIRGEESDRDEEYCRKLCEGLSVKFRAVSCDVIGYSLENHISTEESARILRYRIFEEYSKDSVIATAHNANDNLETVIYNLSRGSALKGICGIPPVRGNIVRPLLTVSREEIENFLKEQNISFVTDSTNLSDDYTRNKIRHNILPVLGNINKSLVKTSVRSIDVLRLENDFIEQEVRKALKEHKVKDGEYINLNELHKVIRQRCLSEYLSENNLPYDYKRLEKMDDIVLNGGKLNISNDLYFISNSITSEFKKLPDKNSVIILEKPLEKGENSIFENIILTADVIDADDFNVEHNKNIGFYYMDYEKINGKMILRNRRNGDRIESAVSKTNFSVKRLISKRVSSEKRPFLHFIQDETGLIFVEGIGVAKRVVTTPDTRKVLRITIKKAE